MKNRFNHTLVFLLVFVVAAVAVTVAALRPSGAMATSPSKIMAFDDAKLSTKMREVATKVSRRHDVDVQSIVAVAPSETASTYTGILVGADERGHDVVAPYNADGMLGFQAVDRRTRELGGVVVIVGTAGPSVETQQVSLMGIAEPRVAKVVLDLADGGTLEAQLVRAGRRGFRFFTYASEDSARFPTAWHAYAANGEEVKSDNLLEDIAPICPEGNPACVEKMSD